MSDVPPLGEARSDRVATILRATVGMVPMIGAPLTELVNTIIPNLRLDRIEDYLKLLTSRMESIGEDEFRRRLTSEPAIDLVEEGAFQAVRALTIERREQISRAVANGLTGDQADLLEAKRMLSLLRQLDEAQVVLLASRLVKNQNQSYRTLHAEILRPIAAHMQSSREDLDRGVVQRIGRQQLVALGLLAPKFKKVLKGQLPEMDAKTGMIASSGDDITPLGRLLLRSIGLASEADV